MKLGAKIEIQAAHRRAHSLFRAIRIVAAASVAFIATPQSAFAAGDLKLTLENPTPDTSDAFGNAVAASNEYLLVGDPNAAVGGFGAAGVAHVFEAGTGAFLYTIENPAPRNGGRFGWDLDFSGDSAVIGAFRNDVGGVAMAGAAYIFDLSTGLLDETLLNPFPAAGDRFGFSVAIDGDDVLIGANLDDPGGVSAAGSAYLFSAATGGHMLTFNSPAPASNDQFGAGGVEISSGKAIVSAYRADPGGVPDAGVAYIFDTSSGALLATLNNPTPEAGDGFGWGVALEGDLAALGARFDDATGQSDGGAAYVFDASSGALLQVITNPAPLSNAQFGHQLALSGDRLIATAPFDDEGGLSNVGRAYLFNAVTGALTGEFERPAPAAGDIFGRAVAAHGDFAIFGSPGAPSGGVSGAGAAYVFDISADEDGDGVIDAADQCAGTMIPEAAPTTGKLGNGRHALTEPGETTFSAGKAANSSYTLDDTGGCSCEQIVDALFLGKGHLKFGCSNGVMEDWVLGLPFDPENP